MILLIFLIIFYCFSIKIEIICHSVVVFAAVCYIVHDLEPELKLLHFDYQLVVVVVVAAAAFVFIVRLVDKQIEFLASFLTSKKAAPEPKAKSQKGSQWPALPIKLHSRLRRRLSGTERQVRCACAGPGQALRCAALLLIEMPTHTRNNV